MVTPHSFSSFCMMGGQDTPGSVTVRRSPTRVAYCDASLPPDLADTLWSDPTSLLDRGELLRAVGKRRTVRLEWAARQFVLKHYRERNWWRALKRTGRRSRAASTWIVMQKLVDAGVPTPRPVACVENRWGLLRWDSFLMYPYVEGETLRSYYEQTTDQARTQNLRQQLKALWRQLSRLRVSLADTNLRNFIVGRTGQVWAIDLDGSRLHRSAFLTAHYQRRAWKRLLRSTISSKRRGAARREANNRLPEVRAA